MDHRERFRALFHFQEVDRLPVYFFGTWHETKSRWRAEGLQSVRDMRVDFGPQVPGMDPDWEEGLWDCQGLVNLYPIGDVEPAILEETDRSRTVRTALGEVIREGTQSSTIPHTLRYALEPERVSWEHFRRWLDPAIPGRYPAGWEERAAALAGEDRVLAFMGGSLYGHLRAYMGIENLSLLSYDDPLLFEEMVETMADVFLELMKPVLKRVRFDLVYFFEDCCGADGPLFSPALYRRVFDRYYRKMIRFYKENGVEFALIDSDGNVEQLVPLWLGSGFDIVFPVEVGKWKGSPAELRRRFGPGLRMLGGVDKHVIPLGEEALRRHLLGLRETVRQGGYLPIPDHRIPPECSYSQFLTYLKVYHQVFNT